MIIVVEDILIHQKRLLKRFSTEEILDIINASRKRGCTSFLFTGGEAFVKNNLKIVLEACRGCFVEIYSNGTLIAEPENLELIKKYVSRLTVTIDGLESHNYYRKGSDYKEILKNIKKVKEKASQVIIKINTLVSRKSIEEMSDLYELLKAIRVDEWHIDFPQLRGRLAMLNEDFCAKYSRIAAVLKRILKKFYEDDKPFFLKIYKVYSSKVKKGNLFTPNLNKNPCSYKTDYSMFINAEGNYILCPSIPCQDIIIAKTKKDSFKDALKAKQGLNFQKMKYSDLKECLKCRYFKLCLGGCRGEAKIISDSFLAPDFNSCSLMKISEKILYPSLPDKIRDIYLDKINQKGKFPKDVDSLEDLKSNNQKRYILSN